MFTFGIFPNCTGTFKEKMQILLICLVFDAVIILPHIFK